jgi:type IV pilus assembly protein PilN
MLKINLLPIRQLKKRAKARSQIAAGIVIFISVLVLLGLVGILQAGRITTLNDEIAVKTKEKKSFDKVIQELADLEKKRLDLNNKIQIINKLKSDSSLTVHVLDEVSNIIDNNRMWLTSLNQRGGSLKLTGYALDNQTVAQFMDELKVSPFINSVSLNNSSLKAVAGTDLKEFGLSCGVSIPQQNGEQVETEADKQSSSLE